MMKNGSVNSFTIQNFQISLLVPSGELSPLCLNSNVRLDHRRANQLIAGEEACWRKKKKKGITFETLTAGGVRVRARVLLLVGGREDGVRKKKKKSSGAERKIVPQQ